MWVESLALDCCDTVTKEKPTESVTRRNCLGWLMPVGLREERYTQASTCSSTVRRYEAVDATNEFYKKAVRWVEGAETSQAQQVEEFGAYAITAFESAPRSVRKWVQEFIGNVKAWMLRRLGIQAGDITRAQLRAMAVYALKSDGRWKIVPDGVAMASETAYSVDNAQTALLPAGQGVAHRNGQETLKSRIIQWADHFNLNGRGGIGLVAGEWEEPSRYKAEPSRRNPFLSADDVVAGPEEGRIEQERLVSK